MKSHFKTQAAIARALKVTRQAVAQWEENGIPIGRQYQIEVLTNGELQADRQPEESAA